MAEIVAVERKIILSNLDLDSGDSGLHTIRRSKISSLKEYKPNDMSNPDVVTCFLQKRDKSNGHSDDTLVVTQPQSYSPDNEINFGEYDFSYLKSLPECAQEKQKIVDFYTTNSVDLDQNYLTLIEGIDKRVAEIVRSRKGISTTPSNGNGKKESSDGNINNITETQNSSLKKDYRPEEISVGVLDKSNGKGNNGGHIDDIVEPVVEKKVSVPPLEPTLVSAAAPEAKKSYFKRTIAAAALAAILSSAAIIGYTNHYDKTHLTATKAPTAITASIPKEGGMAPIEFNYSADNLGQMNWDFIKPFSTMSLGLSFNHPTEDYINNRFMPDEKSGPIIAGRKITKNAPIHDSKRLQTQKTQAQNEVMDPSYAVFASNPVIRIIDFENNDQAFDSFSGYAPGSVTDIITSDMSSTAENPSLFSNEQMAWWGTKMPEQSSSIKEYNTNNHSEIEQIMSISYATNLEVAETEPNAPKYNLYTLLIPEITSVGGQTNPNADYLNGAPIKYGEFTKADKFDDQHIMDESKNIVMSKSKWINNSTMSSDCKGDCENIVYRYAVVNEDNVPGIKTGEIYAKPGEIVDFGHDMTGIKIHVQAMDANVKLDGDKLTRTQYASFVDKPENRTIDNVLR